MLSLLLLLWWPVHSSSEAKSVASARLCPYVAPWWCGPASVGLWDEVMTGDPF